MPVNYAPALDILPNLILAGILALVFYANFRKLNVKSYSRTEFILVRGDDFHSRDEENNSTGGFSPLHENEENVTGTLISSQLVFLSVTLWVAMTMIMIPVSKLYLILPRFGSFGTLIVYSSLAVVIILSLVATVVSRIKITKFTVVLLLIAGGVGVFVSFYLPLMSWASTYGQLMKLVFVYCAVALAEFGIYYITSIMKEKNTARVATVGSYISYFSTSALLAVNIFSNIL